MNLITHFLDKQSSPLTARAYRSDLKLFSLWHWPDLQNVENFTPVDLPNSQWLSVKPADIIAYNKYLQGQGFAWNTRSRRLTALKELYDEAAALGLYDESMASYIKKRIKPGEEGEAKHHENISANEQTALLKVAASQPDHLGLRDYLIIKLLLETGVRRTELLCLKVGNVSIQNGIPTIFVEVAKKNASRQIDIERETYDLIRQWLDESGQGQNDEDPIFCPVRKRGKGDAARYMAINSKKPLNPVFLNRLVTRLKYQAQIETNITPHSFRVATITDTIEGGASLTRVQQVSGHKDTRLITEVYNRHTHRGAISEYRKHKLYKPGEDE
jgi:site-specific recombinase XerD